MSPKAVRDTGPAGSTSASRAIGPVVAAMVSPACAVMPAPVCWRIPAPPPAVKEALPVALIGAPSAIPPPVEFMPTLVALMDAPDCWTMTPAEVSDTGPAELTSAPSVIGPVAAVMVSPACVVMSAPVCWRIPAPPPAVREALPVALIAASSVIPPPLEFMARLVALMDAPDCWTMSPAAVSDTGPNSSGTLIGDASVIPPLVEVRFAVPNEVAPAMTTLLESATVPTVSVGPTVKLKFRDRRRQRTNRIVR